MSTFYLEDFEDHLMNTPGLTATTTSVLVSNALYSTSTLIDRGEIPFIFVPHSVDGDDGEVDGAALLGDSWWAEGLSLHFAPDTGGRYPNYAGLVIPFGHLAPGSGDFPALEAYGPNGELIGVATLPDNWFLSDAGTSGDTFLGFYADQGISKLVPTRNFAYTVDHVQYGWNIPEPGVFMLGLAAVSSLLMRRRR